MSGCTSRKRTFETYASALQALDDLATRGILRGPFGEVYSCENCGEFHVSSRRATLRRVKGRGKARRGVIFDKFQEGA